MSKNLKALVLALVMLCSLLMFAACGQQGSADQTEPATDAVPAGYTVTVVDGLGNPCTEGVIVRFLQNGQQVTMQVVDENGTVTKDLEDGEYTVELQLTGDEAYYYDAEDLTMNADRKELTVTLYAALSGEPMNLFAPSLKGEESRDLPAYTVSTGSTYVELEAGERNYYLFAPTEPGKYHISAQNTDAVLGYYGVTHFVQNTTITEPTDGYIEVQLKQHMLGGGANVLVFGLDAVGSATSAVFTIERVGDTDWSVEDEPFLTYEPTVAVTQYTLPEGAKFGEFDLKAATDTYNLVLDENGYYHLDAADGPLVLVRLGKDSGGSKYLAPLEEIATKALICKYFYDENGEFIKKESYNECIQTYAACVDKATGMYPLTEDLKYIIQQRGDHYGWFEEANTKHGYIFVDDNGNIVPGINNEISWLLYCCYIKN